MDSACGVRFDSCRPFCALAGKTPLPQRWRLSPWLRPSPVARGISLDLQKRISDLVCGRNVARWKNPNTVTLSWNESIRSC